MGWSVKPQGLCNIQLALLENPRRQAGIERAIGHTIPADLSLPQRTELPSTPSSSSTPSTTMITTTIPPIPEYDNLDGYTGTASMHSVHHITEITAPTPAPVLPQDTPIHHADPWKASGILSVPTTTKPLPDNEPLPYQHWWMFDTGSSLHITHDRSVFLTYRIYALHERPYLRFGTTGLYTQAIGVGTVPLILTAPDQRHHSVVIADVQYVPDFIANILSAKLLQQRHRLFYNAATLALHLDGKEAKIKLFDAYNHIFITRDVDRARIARNRAIDTDTVIAANSHVLPSSRPAPAVLWHARLGHPGDQPLQHCKTQTDAKITSLSQFDTTTCEPCRMTKITAKTSRVLMRRGTRL